MASENRHITRIKTTEALFRTNGDSGQSAILTDQSEEWVYYNNAKDKLYYTSNQKYWNGSWNYCANDFGEVTLHDDLLVDEYIKLSSVTDNTIRFEDNKITVTAGGVSSFVAEDDRAYTDLYFYALGGVHVGGTSDPGTDNLVVDGSASVGTTINASTQLNISTALVNGIVVENTYASGTAYGVNVAMSQSNTAPNIAYNANVTNGGAGAAYSFFSEHGLMSNADAVYFGDKLNVIDYITASGGLHVGGTSDPATDNLIVDGYSAFGTTITTGKQINVITTYTSGTAYAGYFEAVTSNDDSNYAVYADALNGGAGLAYSFCGVRGILYNAGYVVALGGVHIGGTTDPGTDNLVVDGTSAMAGDVTVTGASTNKTLFVDVSENEVHMEDLTDLGAPGTGNIEYMVYDTGTNEVGYHVPE